MAGSEPVTSPDQHRPGNRRAGQIGAVVSIVLLVLMAEFGVHRGNVEVIWSYAIAALLAAILIGDVVLRRNGLRR